jgi:hypothetical protein
MAILVDFSSLIVSAARAQRDDNCDEGLLRHMALNVLLSVKKKFGTKYGEIILCCDTNKYWRRDMYPSYKGGRGKSKEVSTFDWDSFYVMMDKIKEEIRTTFPYKMLELPRCEADDIIGVLALEAKEPTIIYSRDRDFIQCQANPLVRLYLADLKKLHEEIKPYEADFLLFEKICTGDKGDWIPNVFSPIDSFDTGTRQKQCKQVYIDEMFKDPESPLWTEDVKARWEMNKQLISLSMIPEEWKQQIRGLEESTPIVGSKGKIFTYLTNKSLNAHGHNFLSDLQSF